LSQGRRGDGDSGKGGKWIKGFHRRVLLVVVIVVFMQRIRLPITGGFTGGGSPS